MVLNGTGTLAAHQKVHPLMILERYLNALSDIDSLGPKCSDHIPLERMTEVFSNTVFPPVLGGQGLTWKRSVRELRQEILLKLTAGSIHLNDLKSQLLNCAHEKHPPGRGNLEFDVEGGRISRVTENFLYGPSYETMHVGSPWVAFCKGLHDSNKTLEQSLRLAMREGRILCLRPSLAGTRLLDPETTEQTRFLAMDKEETEFLFSSDIPDSILYSELEQKIRKMDATWAPALGRLDEWIADAQSKDMRISKNDLEQSLASQLGLSPREAKVLVRLRFPENWSVAGKIPNSRKYIIGKLGT